MVVVADVGDGDWRKDDDHQCHPCGGETDVHALSPRRGPENGDVVDDGVGVLWSRSRSVSWASWGFYAALGFVASGSWQMRDA